MILQAENLSKRFGNQWVIKDFNFEFKPGSKYGLEGSNGSGKSTLLHLCCTYLEPTSGLCQFIDPSGKSIPIEKSYQYFSFAAPYLQLIPHFTINEQLDFTGKMKTWSGGKTTEELLDIMDLKGHRDKLMRSLSSGMRQRVRLVTALAADVDIVFLDEPTTNLDAKGKSWYQDIINAEGDGKTLLIASNEKDDLSQCSEYIQVEDFK